MAEIKGNRKNNTLDGTEEDDDILGKGGNDKLNGLAGDDYLVGGDGKDKLTGGDGADSFVFNEKLGAKNVDQMLDFDINEDSLQLSSKIFKGMGFGLLKDKYVAFASKAADKNDHIIVSDDKDTLFYDPDGKGGKDQIAFVKVPDGTIGDWTLSLFCDRILLGPSI